MECIQLPEIEINTAFLISLRPEVRDDLGRVSTTIVRQDLNVKTGGAQYVSFEFERVGVCTSLVM